MEKNDWISIENRCGLGLYAQRGICLVRGKNSRVWDDQGRMYIDCVAGNGVANIGHANPAVIRSLKRQARTLITCSNLFSNDVRARLMEKLVRIGPPGLHRVYLCNSGAESVEAAIKFARASTKRTDIICAERAFHGRTFGALSATHREKYRSGFEPLVPGFHFIPFNDIEALGKAVDGRTAAVILEVVQGEGGIHIGSSDYFHGVQTLCREKGVLLILDEIQTGFCRTGKMFACQHFDLEPDMLCAAKGIAGGFPMGAVLCSDRVRVETGKHGSTFGGNPLACAAGLAAIGFMEKNALDRAAIEKGEYLGKRLANRTLSKVREIRRLGLMVGIECVDEVWPHVQALQDRGILVFPAGTHVIRLLPPLTIGRQDLDAVADGLAEVLA